MPPPTELKQGEIINNSYRVLAKVGQGGMGAVYKVEHTAMKRLCALKTMSVKQEHQAEQIDRQRFQQEAQTIARLAHKSIVQIYDFGLIGSGTAYYVMDFVEGQTLAARIKEQGQLDMRQALSIFIEVADGLAYAHSQKLVHRDIKPSNIMLANKGGNPGDGSVKIVDFGLAKTVERQAGGAVSNEDSEQITGSPPYMSPEQFRSSAVDHRSDIYSYGCALFEALTGVPPFISDSALVLSMKHSTEAPPSLEQASMGRDFPAELEMIQRRLLAKDADHRYQDLRMVAEDLQAVLDSLKQTTILTPNRRATVSGATRQTASALADSQNITVTPLAPARAARILLYLTPLLLIAACVAITTTLGTGLQNPFLAHSKFEKSAPAKVPLLTTADTISAAPNMTADAPRLEREPANKQPYSKIANGPGGKKLRLFHFPVDVKIGRLVVNGAKNANGVMAAGEMVFDASAGLRFVPSPICCTSPSYLRRFAPDDLYELDLNQNESITSETINYIDHLTGLHDLSLMDTEINNDCISALEQLKGLKYLDVSNTEMTGDGVAKMSNLGQLEGLRVNGLNNVGPLLLALQKSHNLHVLHLDATALTIKDTERLATFKNLHKLTISGTKVGLSGLAALSKSSSLHELSINSDGFQVNACPYLQKFPALRQVTITCDNWTREEIAEFKRSLPNMQLTMDDRF